MDRQEKLKPTTRTWLLIMLVTLMLCGGALVFFSMEYLEQAGNLSSPPNSETIRHVELFILIVTMLAGLPAVGFGAYVMYLGSRIGVTCQWPPAGMGFRTDSPTMLGKQSGWISVVVMVLGLILAIAGLGLPLLGWRLVKLVEG